MHSNTDFNGEKSIKIIQHPIVNYPKAEFIVSENKVQQKKLLQTKCTTKQDF